LGLGLQAAVPAVALALLGAQQFRSASASDVPAPAGVFLNDLRTDDRSTAATAPTTGGDRDLLVVATDNWREAAGSGTRR
jgi:hypothetical protein